MTAPRGTWASLSARQVGKGETPDRALGSDSAPWMTGAPCADPLGTFDPNTFFPDSDLTDVENKANERRAKAFCARCHLIEPCLDYALADPSLQGTWAATTLRDRQAIRASKRDKRIEELRATAASKSGTP